MGAEIDGAEAPEETYEQSPEDAAAEDFSAALAEAEEALSDELEDEPEKPAAKTELKKDEGADDDDEPRAKKPLPVKLERKPKPKDPNARAYIAARLAKKADTHAQRVAELEAQLAAQQRPDPTEIARQLAAQGKHDDALKAVGLPSLTELQRQALAKAGAIDPQLTELEKKLKAFEERDRQKEQRVIEQQKAQMEAYQRQQQEAQIIAEIQEDVAELPYEGADQLAQIPGFTSLIRGRMAQVEGDVDLEELFVQSASEFRSLYEQLGSVFGSSPHPDGDNQAASPQSGAVTGNANRRRRRASTISQDDAVPARAGLTELKGIEPTDDEMSAIIREAQSMMSD